MRLVIVAVYSSHSVIRLFHKDTHSMLIQITLNQSSEKMNSGRKINNFKYTWSGFHHHPSFS